jgi:hypothetical protein
VIGCTLLPLSSGRRLFPPELAVLGGMVSTGPRALERSDLSIDEVAVAAGFGNAGSMRLHLQAERGVSPSTYRMTFRGRHRSAGSP